MRRREFLATTALVSIAGCSTQTPQNDYSSDLEVPHQGEGGPIVRVFGDYACHYCTQYTLQEYPEIRAKLIDSGEIEYRHYDFPLPVSEWSFKIAYVARWIQANYGLGAYWTFHPSIFAHAGDYSLEVVARTAVRATGEDISDEIGTVIEDEAFKETILAEKKVGKDEYDVEGTPYVFVGDERVEPTAKSLVDAVESL